LTDTLTQRYQGELTLNFSSKRGLTFPGMANARFLCASSTRGNVRDKVALILIAILALWSGIPIVHARAKDTTQYGAGLIVNVPFPVADVTQAVNEVTQSGIIRGSKEYDREEYVTGAEVATSVRGFPTWQEGGTVFYKVRTHALDPRNFKESGDVGTLAVRYVLQPQGEKNTVLRIDAIFVEDFRHTVHLSNGSVEGAEYKDIHDRLETLHVLQQQAAEAASQGTQVNAKLLRKESSAPSLPVQSRVPADAVPSGAKPRMADLKPSESPEEHLKSLRRQVERTVKSPGAPLKASPFRTAKTLVSLPSGTEVLIVISTPYWFGVETHQGQHGWVSRDELEILP
jgi:hypothetical protein